MANVEVSKNIGPHQEKYIDAVTTTQEGEVFHSADYTIHSYQVILGNSPVSGSTNILFEILCTNDDGNKDGSHPNDATNYQPIASYTIDSSTNTNGIMYSDVWNFKYAKCKITVNNIGNALNVSVIEKHNA